MATAFQRPENALKRAEELISVGQDPQALHVLYATLTNRRLRYSGWDLNAELIMLKYIRLCVQMEKYEWVREGLHFFRNLTQQHNVLSLAKVVKELRELSENKLEAVKARADEAVISPGEDLEADESPESIMLSTLQVEVRDKSATQLHEALFGCWESYKIILDALRFAPKIDYLYHDTAQRALEFCRVNKRPNEFRRLCDTLRLHYMNLQKQRGKPEFESFLKPETHLTTRLCQMDVAADLGLWSQCFQTAEDVLNLGLHELLQKITTTGHENKRFFLAKIATYYEKLALIFRVSGQPLFHATALLHHIFHKRTHKKVITTEEQTVLSNTGTIAVLCIPSLDKGGKQQSFTTAELEHRKKLASMVGHGSTIPSLELMQKTVETKNILSAASQQVQNLYFLVNGEIDPLKFCETASSYINEVTKNFDYLLPYVQPLKKIILEKLIMKLSVMYSSMRIDFFVNHVCPEDFMSWVDAETHIIQLVYEGYVNIKLNYANRIIFFDSAIDPQSLLKSRLMGICNISRQLEAERQRIVRDETKEKSMDMIREAFYSNFEEKLQVEACRIADRNRRLAAQKEKQESELQKKEEERKNKELEKLRMEEQSENRRKEMALKHQEQIRRKEEIQQRKSQISRQIIAEFKSLADKAFCKIIVKGKHLEDITPEDIMSLSIDYDDYAKGLAEYRRKEREEKTKHHRHELKRVEYMVRALREEELPLIEVWEKETEKEDKIRYEKVVIEATQEAEKGAEEAIIQQHAFRGVESFKNDWFESHMRERRETYNTLKKQREEKIRNVVIKQKLNRARIRLQEAREKEKALEAARKKEEERKKETLQEERRKKAYELQEEKRKKTLEMQREKHIEIERRAMAPSTYKPSFNKPKPRGDFDLGVLRNKASGTQREL